MKIYNELESLGFFEWLKEKGFGSGFTAMILDAQPFDSIERSGYNAIAFRWFREKYKLDSMVQPTYSTKYQYRMFHIEGKTKVQIYGAYMGKAFKTYEEAELECLKKLIEIKLNTHNTD